MSIEMVCILILGLLQLDTSRKLREHRKALVIIGEEPRMKAYVKELVNRIRRDQDGN